MGAKVKVQGKQTESPMMPVGKAVESQAGRLESLCTIGRGRTILDCRKKSVFFSQGELAEAIFYIRAGAVKLSATSHTGKEAVTAVLGEGDFFGEGCLAAEHMRRSTAVAISICSVMRIDKPAAIRLLARDSGFSALLFAYLIRRTIRAEEDLIDQLFNHSEKRLARALLLLAKFGTGGKPDTVIPKISQETLAAMIGTTRPRVSEFMNKFRKLGFIKYNGHLEIHTSLLQILLYD